jgi:hypothetical protein
MTEYNIYFDTDYSSGTNVASFQTLEDMTKHLEYMRSRNKMGLAYFNIECKKITIERLDIQKISIEKL